MANLHEYVLRHIFKYLETPLDWIKVSQVCRLWEQAAKNECWRKIAEIDYHDMSVQSKSWDILKNGETNVQVISAKDAERIIYYAAPFIKILSGEAYFMGKEKLIMFGQFLYKVQGFKTDMILKLLTQKATNISEISFDRPPRAPLLNLLFNANNIRTVKFNELEPFYKHVPTDKIEELEVRLQNIKNVKSFEGHFSNLKKLDLTVDCKNSVEPERMLSPILPHVAGLKTFNLYVTASKLLKTSNKFLLDVAEFVELEKLSLKFDTINVRSINTFLEKLETGCPKLRELVLQGYYSSKLKIGILMTLPCLEILIVECYVEFTQLSRMSTLTQLEIRCSLYDLIDFNITSFSNVLKMMPELKSFSLSFSTDDYTVMFQDNKMELIREVAAVVVSQKKNLDIIDRYDRRSKLRIKQKDADSSDTEIKTLTFVFPFVRKIDGTIVDSMKTFMRKNFDSSWVVTLEACE